MDNLKSAFLELEKNLKFKERNLQESKSHHDDLDMSGSLSDDAGADEQGLNNEDGDDELEPLDDMLDLLTSGGGEKNGKK
jgi:hypothetical protein